VTPSQAAKILGCEVLASPDEVRAAFAKCAKILHPDTEDGMYAVQPPAEWARMGGPVIATISGLKQARDVLLQRPAQACGVCRGTGWQSVGMKRVRCVKGCDESS
jgi:hypothetical protein